MDVTETDYDTDPPADAELHEHVLRGQWEREAHSAQGGTVDTAHSAVAASMPDVRWAPAGGLGVSAVVAAAQDAIGALDAEDAAQWAAAADDELGDDATSGSD